jgi:shikimate kinase
MKNIYLIGFMGSGKSFTGHLMSKSFGFNFLDLDQFIVESSKMSIPDIFSNLGEVGFRERESLYLRKTAELKNTMISCGGGTPCFNENMAWIKNNGISIYLKTSEELLFNRLNKQKSGRPLISNMTDNELKDYISIKIKEREFYYNQADYISLQEENGDLPIELQSLIKEKLERNRT